MLKLEVIADTLYEQALAILTATDRIPYGRLAGGKGFRRPFPSSKRAVCPFRPPATSTTRSS